MGTNFLLNKILKGETDYNNKETRTKVATFASIVGLIANIILTVVKISIGVAIHSVSVIADGANNLADAASSIINLIGFKLSNKPPDKEHPYGHGRIEYLSALMVAIIVILVGFEFLETSFNRVKNPQLVEFEIFAFIILIISIFIKAWLAKFNYDIGKKISSTGLMATAYDALGDVLTTSVVVISIFAGRYTTLPIDGIIGILLSLLIMYNGLNLVKETINPLIGEAPDDELVRAINMDVLTYDYIIGTHDLMIHSYGHGNTIATIDVEFPADVDNITIHDVIDSMEREIGEKYNLKLIVHMDPLGPESDEVYELRKKLKKLVKADPIAKSIHDFQVLEIEGKEVVEFHLVIDGNKLGDRDMGIDSIKEEFENLIKEHHTNLDINLIIDLEY